MAESKKNSEKATYTMRSSSCSWGSTARLGRLQFPSVRGKKAPWSGGDQGQGQGRLAKHPDASRPVLGSVRHGGELDPVSVLGELISTVLKRHQKVGSWSYCKEAVPSDWRREAEERV